MLILLERPPAEHCASISAESITLYINYKRDKWKGEELKRSDGTLQLDIFDAPVLCLGGWSAPHNAAQMITAVNALHKAKDITGPYAELCKDCVDAVATSAPGCSRHLYNPRTSRVGDPSKSRIVSDALKSNQKGSCCFID